MKPETNSDEIVNRVANTARLVFDLEDYYPEGERLGLMTGNNIRTNMWLCTAVPMP